MLQETEMRSHGKSFRNPAKIQENPENPFGIRLLATSVLRLKNASFEHSDENIDFFAENPAGKKNPELTNAKY